MCNLVSEFLGKINLTVLKKINFHLENSLKIFFGKIINFHLENSLKIFFGKIINFHLENSLKIFFGKIIKTFNIIRP